MNFRELINKLDQINEAEGLTLQSIAATEKAAMDKAVAEKAKGGFTGFTTWDPRSAGNIALAKLAQQNNFEGLFNSEGDFVVAYGNRTWSSNSEMHPGENPRVVPPSPDDWKPLAAKGLIPQNAKGPADLTNWLSSGGAQKEFDAVKKQSADVAGGAVAGASPAQGAKVSSADEEAKMTQLEGLVDQYLKLKADIKTGVKKSPAPAKKDPMDDSDDANAHPFDPTWGGTKPTPGDKYPPNMNGTWSNEKQKGIPGVVKETALAAALVESFGYQKKTSIAELVENFIYQNKNFQKLLEADDDFSLTSKYDKPNNKNDDNFDPDEYLKSKYGDADDTKSGRVDRRSWKEKHVITTTDKAADALVRTISGKNKTPVSKDEQSWWDTAFHNKYWNNWTEDTLSWDDEIIPNQVFTFRDLAMDLGIATGLVIGGTILAPFTAGTSLGGTAAGAYIVIKWLIRIGKGLVFLFNSWGKVAWELAKRNGPAIRRAISAALKPHADVLRKSLVDQLGPKAFSHAFLWTIGFNGLSALIKEKFPKTHAAIGKGVDDAVDKIQPGIDLVRKKTGWEEGLQ